jgi:hypothetical protein
MAALALTLVQQRAQLHAALARGLQCTQTHQPQPADPMQLWQRRPPLRLGHTGCIAGVNACAGVGEVQTVPVQSPTSQRHSHHMNWISKIRGDLLQPAHHSSHELLPLQSCQVRGQRLSGVQHMTAVAGPLRACVCAACVCLCVLEEGGGMRRSPVSIHTTPTHLWCSHSPLPPPPPPVLLT